MQDFGEHFGSAGDGDAAAVEEAVAVGEGYLVFADGAEGGPPGERFEDGAVLPGSVEREAAGGDDQELGVGFAEQLRRDGEGVLVSISEDRIAAGDVDQLRTPVAEDDEGGGPFEARDGGSGEGGGGVADGIKSGAEGGDEFVGTGLVDGEAAPSLSRFGLERIGASRCA